METIIAEKETYITAIGYNSNAGTGLGAYFSQIKDKAAQRGGVIERVDPQQYLGIKGNKFLNKATLMYCNVAFQCIEEKVLRPAIEAAPHKVGLYDCSDLSNIQDGFLFDLMAKVEGPDYVSPMSAPNTIANAASSQMAIKSKIKGPNFTVCSGACSSLQALDIANLHLGQGMVNHAIVGSTEVVAKYQEAVRRGEGRKTHRNADEVAVAMLLQKEESGSEESRYARILGFRSGTQLAGESPESLLLRLIRQATRHYQQHPINLIIVGGGYHNLNLLQFQGALPAGVPVAYPEAVIGTGDNAGGMLGILYAIGVFRGEIDRIATTDVQQQFAEQNIDTAQVNNVLVCTIDKAGYALVTLVAR